MKSLFRWAEVQLPLLKQGAPTRFGGMISAAYSPVLKQTASSNTSGAKSTVAGANPATINLGADESLTGSSHSSPEETQPGSDDRGSENGTVKESFCLLWLLPPRSAG